MKANQKGFGVVEILIAIVVIGLVGAVGWLVYDRQKNKTSETQNTKTSTQQETKKADPNEGYLVVKEWGLRFKIPGGLTDVQYKIQDNTVGGDSQLAIYAKPSGANVQYRSDYTALNQNGYLRYAIGSVTRSTESMQHKAVAGSPLVSGKKLGDYYYYTTFAFNSLTDATSRECYGLYGDSKSAADCQAETTVFQLVNRGDAALLNTIELAQ